MKVELKNEFQTITITDEHAASSYGIPVAVFNGQAFGPGDFMNTIPAGDELEFLNQMEVASTTVAAMVMEAQRNNSISSDELDFVRKFFL